MRLTSLKTTLTLILAATLAAAAPSVCHALTLTGSLLSSSPVWNRIKDNGVTNAGTCAAIAPDSFNNGVPYKTFTLRANTATMLSARVAGAVFDSFLTLHCGTISTSSPSANLMAADDDSGGYPNAALGASLSAGQTYYLTVSSYQAAPTYGAFSLDVVGDVTVILPTVTLSSASVAENADLGAAVGTLDVADAVPGETYVYSLVAGTGSTDNGSFSVSGSQLLTAVALDFETKSSYSVRVRADGSQGSIAEAQFAVTVTNVDEAPTATPQSVTVDEDATKTITLSGHDPEGSALTYAVASGPSHGSLSGSGNVRTYAPTANYNGPDSFTFTVSDGTFTSSPATVSITVAPMDDAPTATPQSVATDEDVPLSITLTGTDLDGDAISAYAVVSGPSHGSISPGSGAARTYTPNQDFNGSDSFTFTVTANGQTSAPATVSITVRPVNDPPVVGGSPAAEVFKGQTYSFTPTATDPDEATTLTWSIVNKPSWASFSATTGQLSGAPAKSQVGTYSGIVISVSDGALSASLPAFAIVVRDVNDAPTAISLIGPGAATRNAPTGTVVGRLVATDPDAGDSFTFALVAGAGGTDNGLFAIQGDILATALSLGGQPQASRSVRVRVTDSGGLSLEQSFVIQILDDSRPVDILRYIPAMIKKAPRP